MCQQARAAGLLRRQYLLIQASLSRTKRAKERLQQELGHCDKLYTLLNKEKQHPPKLTKPRVIKNFLQKTNKERLKNLAGCLFPCKYNLIFQVVIFYNKQRCWKLSRTSLEYLCGVFRSFLLPILEDLVSIHFSFALLKQPSLTAICNYFMLAWILTITFIGFHMNSSCLEVPWATMFRGGHSCFFLLKGYINYQLPNISIWQNVCSGHSNFFKNRHICTNETAQMSH